MGHDITKEFLIDILKIMAAGFLLRSQKLLRYFTPEMMHFQAGNIFHH